MRVLEVQWTQALSLVCEVAEVVPRIPYICENSTLIGIISYLWQSVGVERMHQRIGIDIFSFSSYANTY